VKPNGAELIQLVRGLFIITDPGRDQDDEDTLVLLNRAVRYGILEILGVVANLAPSIERARLARGTLKMLGQDQIPVGFGSGAGVQMLDDNSLPYEFQVGYLSPHDQIRTGEELILETLHRAPSKGVILTLISTLADAAEVLESEQQLFCEKVRRVVIMGGVRSENELPLLDPEGFLLPDPTAQNHAFDQPAADFLYKRLQQLAVPLTVLSRHAAAAAKVDRSMYDRMAQTGHPVGIRLRDAQKKAIEHLWLRANLSAGDERRKGLPDRCDRAWFCKAFCGGEGLERTASDSVWNLVKTFMLYDPCTLLAAMPGLREYFYSPYVHELFGAEHLVIGLSQDRHGVARPQELAEYLAHALVESLELSLPAVKALG